MTHRGLSVRETCSLSAASATDGAGSHSEDDVSHRCRLVRGAFEPRLYRPADGERRNRLPAGCRKASGRGFHRPRFCPAGQRTGSKRCAIGMPCVVSGLSAPRLVSKALAGRRADRCGPGHLRKSRKRLSAKRESAEPIAASARNCGQTMPRPAPRNRMA